MLVHMQTNSLIFVYHYYFCLGNLSLQFCKANAICCTASNQYCVLHFLYSSMGRLCICLHVGVTWDRSYLRNLALLL